jgi:rhodanese-related sulfurtransferase
MKIVFPTPWAIVLAMAILTAPGARAQSDPAATDVAFGDPALAAASALTPQRIAPAEVLKMMNDKRSDIALVDTQPAEGFADTHIPGAINYPWVMRIKSFPITLPRNRMLIFYGSCPNDTMDMVKQLAEFGYFNVKVMDGGIEKWMELHYPTAGASGDQLPSPQLSQLTSKAAKSATPAGH